MDPNLVSSHINELAEMLRDLAVHSEKNFNEIANAIQECHAQVSKAIQESVAVHLKMDSRTIAALGGREAVGRVALHAAGARRHQDALAALPPSQQKALRALSGGDADYEVRFLAHRAGATP